ncbi:sensor histidine kinase [Aneurinibacillus sp. REN35]|uniref:sensor histidine kinase n=1 Tax=Aneurinibacillus sp. REN35 TaxID=3237286 RepID=UPI0035298956
MIHSLYTRIVFMVILISIMSSILAFFISNAYYQANLKEYNEQKIMRIGEEIVSLYGTNSTLSMDEYFKKIANMNFQLYVFDERYERKIYGARLGEEEISRSVIQDVLGGNKYNGISQYQSGLFVTGFFKSDIKNSVGLPLRIGENKYAVFVRPNIEQQFGEVHIIFGILVAFTFLFTLMFVLVFTRFLVKPLRVLKGATRKISEGNYKIALDYTRRDEFGELAKDFSAMAASLEKLESMRQEFVSNVSHEIQSPLTSIKGFSKALQSEELPEEQRIYYLKIIEKESTRLSALSKQLLMLASLDKGAVPLKKTTYQLDAQIREVLLLTEWQWSAKHINVELEMDEVSIYADYNLLQQVWTNLITNSIKFMEPHGKLTIRLHSGKHIHVEISDTGVGIKEEDLPHIFERFYKASKSRSRTEGGSGLGLSIVKKIIELHDGKITIASIRQEGTTFTIEFPHL